MVDGADLERLLAGQHHDPVPPEYSIAWSDLLLQLRT